jgi:predicted nucleotidyltransferase
MKAKTQIKIDIPRAELTAFCQRNHICWPAFFGSVLRDDFNPESDIDVLVEFEPDYRVGLIRLAGMEIELSELIERKVDLRTPGDLSHYLRQDVLDTPEVQYVHG